MNASARRVALVSFALLVTLAAAAPPAAAQAVFVNEIHYDNTGTDAGEAIEIAGPAGTDLTGWSIVLYNGNTPGAAVTYDTDTLSGTIPNSCSGFGVVVLTYPSNGIQNGAPDGLALVNASNVVVQFLSYEGVMTASNGPATGMTSTDIGVSETGSEAVGLSLRLAGTGSTYSDFSWQAAATHTFGSCNTGQTFQNPDPVLNEFSASTAGTDVEFVEVFGAPGTSFSSFTILEIEGDSGGTEGTIDEVIPVGTTNASGFWLASLAANSLENNTLTLLLVEGFSGTAGTDLDTNNDGTFDSTPWTRIVDAVAVSDGGASDRTYGVPVLGPNYDGVSSFAPGGASRIPDGTDNDATTDWVRNDFDLAGIPPNVGTPVFGEAYNTPGATNQAVPAESAPAVVSTVPANGATAVAAGTTVTITFSETVNVASAATFSIECPASLPVGFTVTTPATLPAAATTFVITPAGALPTATTCTVTVFAAAVTDADANDPPDNMAADYVFSFTTSAPVVLTPIHDIQGNGLTSPLVGQTVSTRGVVTALKFNNGFFLQEPDASVDADPATSEGLFVFTSSPPTVSVGQLVTVTGTVTEYNQAGQYGVLTELVGPLTITTESSGNTLPAPVLVTAAMTSPTGIWEQLENLEGMRVSVAGFTVTAATDGNPGGNYTTGTSFGDCYGVVPGVARPFREDGIAFPDPPPASTTIPPLLRFDSNPEVLRVDTNGQVGAANHDLSARTVLPGFTGVLDYGFSRYSILPDVGSLPASPAEFPPTAVTAPTAREFTVASYNLQRFFDDANDPAISEPVLTGAQYQARLNKASVGIRNYMRTPDVVGVVEVENLSTLQALATRINSDAVAASQPDPQYVAYLVEGNDVGGIDVGFLVKTASVGASPRVEVLSVTQELDGTPFTNPDSSTETLNDRPPLMLRAVVHSAGGGTFPVTVIVNHLRSMNGVDDDSPGSDGWTTVGERVRAKRQAQAVDLASFVQARQASDPSERIILVGDFNAFSVNDSLGDLIATIVGAPAPGETTAVTGDGADLVNPDLVNLGPLAAAAERYSYVFDFTGQMIDHGIVNAALVNASLTRRVEYARINADFPEVDRSTTDARLSDHDPLVVFVETAAFASAGLSTTITDSPDPVLPGAGVAYTVTVTNGGPDAAAGLTLTITVPAGTTYVGTTAPAGWSCAQAAGTVTCTAATLAAATNAVFTMSVTVGAGTPAGTVLSSTATVTQSSGEATPGDESDTEQTTVQTPPAVLATKAVGGFAYPGGALTYTVVLTNYGSTGQADNPGNEFVDVLPSSLVLVSASATSGTAVANVGANTVTWNGAIPAGGSVTITIAVRVSDAATVGSVISNQGTVSWDGNGDLVNESSAPTDDPATGAAGDPTSITVLGGVGGLTAVPALDGLGLGLLALLVALGGALVLGRKLA